jgi:SAM-dependent methyltransferase
MRKQQQIWLAEHTDRATLPTMANSEPASGVILFVEFLKQQRQKFAGAVVDIGSGKGRNSVHLASLGYDVYAMEYIQPAIDAAEVLAQKRGVSGKVHFANAEIDTRWRYDDNFFDIAIDSFASIDVETRRGREILRDEMLRTLKPGGVYLLRVEANSPGYDLEVRVRRDGPTRWTATFALREAPGGSEPTRQIRGRLPSSRQESWSSQGNEPT